MARATMFRNVQQGVVAIEFGLVLPVLLLFVLGLMECGRLFWTYTTLYRATQAAARCGAVNATLCGTVTQIQSYAVTQAYGLTVQSSVFTAQTAVCGIQVVGTLPVTLMIPWSSASKTTHSFNVVTLVATSCYPK